MTLTEAYKAFEQWLDANYGDAHPCKGFMRNAWEAGFLYAKTISQQGVQADAHRRCQECGGIIGSYSATCNSGQHTRTA